MNLACVPPALWATAIVLPLVLAAGGARPSWRGALGVLAPWAALPALLGALWWSDHAPIDVEGFLLGVRLGVDELGRTFLLFTALLWLVSGWFAQGYLEGDRRAARFHVCWLLAMAGNFTVVLAQDMVGFYAGFALMSFSAYGLVIHTGDAEALYAGRVYIALVVVGELLLFMGLVLLAHTAGGTAFASLQGRPVSALTVLLVLAGFGIKAGALPLHVWLPLAHPAAPVPASAVLSGAMIKAGLLGWLRFLPVGTSVAQECSGPLMVAGLAAAFLGVIVGVAQSNAKTVLAYSSISQMGLMTVGVGAVLLGPDTAPGAVAAVALYALHHGLAKGALFLGVGLAAEAVTPGQRRALGVGLLLPTLALAGAPWTSGAVAKTALKASLATLPAPWPTWLNVLAPLAAVGTTLLMARFLAVLWSADAAHAAHPRRYAMWTSWAALLISLAGATWLWPAASVAARDALSPSKLWVLSWPVLAGALLGWAAYTTLSNTAPRRLQIPPGDLLAGAEWCFARLRRCWPGEALRAVAKRGADAATLFRDAVGSHMARRFHGTAEIRLRAWPNVGVLLLLISGAVFLTLAW